MPLHILGIRHHGVGSARYVAERIEALQPDLILVEGPPEMTEALQVIGHEALKPPVSVMLYNIDNPQQAVFYPFATFSPEWVAALYANKNRIPLRAIDLPVAISFQQALAENDTTLPAPVRDPLDYLAEVDGFASGSALWDHYFENHFQVHTSAEHFEAVMLTMETLRQAAIPSPLEEENTLREAYMRECIRKAQNELYQNIVIVCGAWHAPALVQVDTTAKADAKLLKTLPKTKIKPLATWIAWTAQRLALQSGYGAGISSPGWYAHRWKYPQDTAMLWLTQVAGLFRSKQVDISTAHVIEAYRLACTLASLRNRPQPTLNELNEAVISVMCMGDAVLFQLVEQALIIGNKLGKVPEDIPKVPLQEDFEKQIKSLRLSLTANAKQYDLDLRQENDLKRSVFLHRLAMLSVTWGRTVENRNKGTFKESWVLEWSPAMILELIDKAYYGNTVQIAAQQVILQQLQAEQKLGNITSLLSRVIPAELFECIEALLLAIQNLASVSADVVDLMAAYPTLVQVSRYGNVRKTDLSMMQKIADGLFTRISIGLGNACYGLDEANSEQMFRHIVAVNEAVRLNQQEEAQTLWLNTLQQLLARTGIHPLILGCTSRLLFDAQIWTTPEAEQHFAYALSPANPPSDVAAWIEGFLKGSGAILIYDDTLWNLLYAWVASLSEQHFTELLPILRRTFSQFEYAQRKQIGEKARKGLVAISASTLGASPDIDEPRAEMILPILEQLMAV